MTLLFQHPKEPVANTTSLYPSNLHRCRFCDEPLLTNLVDLGMSPPCESFRRLDQLDEKETYYPLKVWACTNCYLVQIAKYIEPEDTFIEYAYFSSYSTSWVAHAATYCDTIHRKLELGSSSLVVEVGSNDGYLLQHFVEKGIPVLGIEPAANVAATSVQKGIRTKVAFFGRKLAQELVASGLQADLIVGNNVLAQVPDLNDFVSGLAILVKPGGTITLEFPHLQKLLSECQFDTIYHEHYSYFSLTNIQLVAARHGLDVVDVEEPTTHGGSLRVHLCPEMACRKAGKAVVDLLDRERAFGLCESSTYGSFAGDVRRIKRDLLSFLIAAKNDGKRVCGYGAPGKGNTLLNYCGIGVDLLEFTVDCNPNKHGLFTPGMHIPIYPVEALYKAQPDYVLILPWNLKNEIARQLCDLSERGSKLVVPIPRLAIIDSEGNWL